MRRKMALVLLTLAATLLVGIWSAAGQDQINYISQPEELTVFLNDVVFVRDVLRVPPGSETQIVLPPQIVPHTVTLRDDDGHIPLYAISFQTGQYVLTVRDDGKGLPPDFDAGSTAGHHGLLGMEQRVTALGGSMQIDSSAHAGVRIRIEVPLTASVLAPAEEPEGEEPARA